MLIIDCGSPRVPEIARHIQKLGSQAVIVELDALAPHHFEGVEAAIFSGSPRMMTEEKTTLITRLSFITELEIPLLGICFGHQLLGVLHGAQIRKNRNDNTMIQGNQEIWLENSPLFTGIEPVTTFRQDHEEEISLPENFMLIGSSQETLVEAMCHKTKPIYSVQFHPEVSGEEGFKVFENFTKLCVKKVLVN